MRESRPFAHEFCQRWLEKTVIAECESQVIFVRYAVDVDYIEYDDTQWPWRGRLMRVTWPCHSKSR